MQQLISRVVPTGVHIVTVRAGDKVNGMTAAWVTQVSFKPAMIGVAIVPKRYTYELLKQSGYFCINALPADAIDIAKHFGYKSGRQKDKMADIKFTNALKGSPVIEGAYGYVECELENTYPAGDHEIVVGTVVDAAELIEGAEPLIFRWNDFFGATS